MRLVRITIEYDMDDQEKSLHDELKDWVQGYVDVQDLFHPPVQWTTAGSTAVSYHSALTTIRINELDSQGESEMTPICTHIGDIYISTVLLENVYETMAFDRSDPKTAWTDLFCHRTMSVDQAIINHCQMIERFVWYAR